MTNKVYDIVTDRILEALDQGTVPWHKPWSSVGLPRNATTNRPYNGVNVWLLGMSSYSDTRWLTYKQATGLGGTVCKGEKATLITFWKQLMVDDEKKGEGATKNIPLLRYFNVFNVEQCEGLNLPPVETNHVEPIEAARAIIDEMPNAPTITHGGDQAYYSPTMDSVHMPSMDSFLSSEEYYSTTFHELSHSTGHKSRLDRESSSVPVPFGSDVYSKEELVAEFGASFLCATAGIDNTLDNSAAYIAGWRKALKADNRLLISAASQGQKAANYITGS